MTFAVAKYTQPANVGNGRLFQLRLPWCFVIAEVWHCPMCGLELESAGVIRIRGQDCSVFQCETCVWSKPIFGRPFEVAVTFAVNDAGQAFDPVDEQVIG